MPALSFTPAFSLLAAWSRVPARPLRTWWRTTEHRFFPSRPALFHPRVRSAQEAVLNQPDEARHRGATLWLERRRGTTPTIILGGFIPDGAEQVYLLRGFLLKHGSVYYVNYPTHGFSTELIFAQLDDLVHELTIDHGQLPVILGVSFGAGLVLEWLKRARRLSRTRAIRGLVLVSPVACVEDLLAPGDAKPTTLLGRAIKPYLSASGSLDSDAIERSRAIFTKMFESGAQNKEALRGLLTRQELQHLRNAVMATLQSISPAGALERVQALRRLESPSTYFSQTLLPLSEAPTLILYAEKEGAVLTEHAPSRFALETAHTAYFPNSICKTISNKRGSPVQHASLLFHCFNFLPPISAHYRGLKKRNALKAA